MARGSFAYRDGDLIGEGFTGGPPSQAAPFAVDVIHDSPWIAGLPKPFRADGLWGWINGRPLGQLESDRLNYLRITFEFFPGAAAALNRATASAFGR